MIVEQMKINNNFGMSFLPSRLALGCREDVRGDSFGGFLFPLLITLTGKCLEISTHYPTLDRVRAIQNQNI